MRNTKNFRLFIHLLAAGGVIAGLVLLSVKAGFISPKSELAYGEPPLPRARRTLEEQQNIDVYKKTNEAVVFISTITLTYDPFDMFMEIKPRKGSGSGIIIDAQKGLIITNLHVIQNAHKIEIVLADKQSYNARLVGYDKAYDLVVLQLHNPPDSLTAIPFGDSSQLEVGQRVLAIGNPFGLHRTLTTGIISSLNRTVRSPDGRLLHGLIQTDAAINPGNSGGPLLDSEGRLIGINTAILSQSGDSAGIGFAVPINRIKEVLPELVATGKVLRPTLGWILADTNQGPMVWRVIPGGPADKAMIAPVERASSGVFLRGYVRDFDRADLVYKVNGKRVKNKSEVESLVIENGARELELTLRRGGIRGAERVVTVKPQLQ
ncbi:MAG: 2-alkenal reductase [Candidatus Dadabacteria bacterium]|nr:MAG: 2-alkenal reductase [Candidatus Dadabacteria bacterium]